MEVRHEGDRRGRRGKFIAPSLPFQGDQAVDAHAARAPAPPPTQGEGYYINAGTLSVWA